MHRYLCCLLLCALTYSAQVEVDKKELEALEGITTESPVEWTTANLNYIETVETYPKRNKTDGRLAGGITADITQYPYTVVVAPQDIDGLMYFCSGVLLTSSFALTAATCVVDAVTIYVGGGATTLDDEPWFISQSTPIIFPWFSRNTLEHNIALLRLGFPVPTNIPPVGVVDLPASFLYKTHLSLVGRTLRVVGYGSSSASAAVQELNYADFQVPAWPTCKVNLLTNYRYTLSTYQACLENGQEVKGACRGDLGAPVLIAGSNTLVGIINDYFRCEDNPIFTRIGPYIPWIRYHVPGIQTTFN